MSKWNEYELAENNMGSANIENIETKQIICNDMVIEDRPMFFAGRNAGNIDTDIIIDFNDVQVDTHNAYKGGVWQCPKDGVYEISAFILMYLAEDSVYVDLFITGHEHQSGAVYDNGADTFQRASMNRVVKLNKGDLVYCKAGSTDDNEYVFGGSSWHTNLSITYIGA